METTFDYKLDGNVYKVLVVKKNNKNTYIKIKDDLTIYVTTNYLTSKREVKTMLDNERDFLHKALSRARKKLEKEELFYYRYFNSIFRKSEQVHFFYNSYRVYKLTTNVLSVKFWDNNKKEWSADISPNLYFYYGVK